MLTEAIRAWIDDRARLAALPRHALAENKREIAISHTLKKFARPVKFEEGCLTVSLDPGSPADFAGKLGAKLTQWLGRRWVVVVSRDKGGDTLEEIEKKILEDALRKNGGNRSLTAEQLGLSRRTIQRKIQDYGLPF